MIYGCSQPRELWLIMYISPVFWPVLDIISVYYPYTPCDVQLVGRVGKNAMFSHRYNYPNRGTWMKLALMKGSVFLNLYVAYE